MRCYFFPLKIVACPYCKGITKYPEMPSFWAAEPTWTDGSTEACSTVVTATTVVKCRQCSSYYWLDKAELLGALYHFSKHADFQWNMRGRTQLFTSDGQSADSTWVAAPGVKEPTEKEYYQALEKGLATNPQEERSLRVLAWWRRNDGLRSSRAQATGISVVSDAFKKNLEFLLSLLDETNHRDLYIKAEILRELGEFEAAKEVLTSRTLNKYSAIVRQLWSLCENKDNCVRWLNLEAQQSVIADSRIWLPWDLRNHM